MDRALALTLHYQKLRHGLFTSIQGHDEHPGQSAQTQSGDTILLKLTHEVVSSPEPPRGSGSYTTHEGSCNGLQIVPISALQSCNLIGWVRVNLGRC